MPRTGGVATGAHQPPGASPRVNSVDTVLNRYWIGVPAMLRRYTILASTAWQDGLYLTAWPTVARTVPLMAGVVGLVEGVTHFTIPTDAAPVGVPVVSFVQMLPFLILVCVAGAFSANLALILALGYAVGDFVLAGPQASVGTVSDNPFLAALSQRWPMLIGYALLLALAVLPTLVSEQVLAGLRQVVRGATAEAFMVRAAIMAVAQAALVYSWSLMAPVIIRILWSAVNSIPINQGINSIQVPGVWLAVPAAIAVLVRGQVMYQAYRDPTVVRRARQLNAALRAADGRPAATRRLSPVAGVLVSAAALTLFLSGLAANVIEGAFIFLLCVLLGYVRTVLPQRPGPWADWARLVTRIPLVVRLVAGVGLAYVIAQAILATDLPVVFNDQTGSFQPVLLSVCATLLVLTVLAPRSKRESGQAGPNR